MKILQINVVCGVGSTGRIATDLYKELENEGHEGLIAYGRGNAPEGINSYKIGSQKDIFLHVVKTRVFDKTGFGSKKATENLIKVIDEYNPDVIHLHNLHGYYVNIEILFDYLRRINKPVIWTMHDCWSFTGHCSHFDYVGCEKWKRGCINCAQKKEYPSSILADNSKWNYEMKKKLFTSLENLTIVTPSKWLAALVKESFLGKYEVKVINNSIDLSIFKPSSAEGIDEKLQIKDKFMILGAATTWDNKKGLNDFMKLADKVHEDTVIVLVGLNDNQIKNLPKKVIGLKRTDSVQELAELYSRAQVFVNTSVEETFGLVTVEAMACGTPVVVYNATAAPELVPSNCGFVVEPNDINELNVAINSIKDKGKEAYSLNCINEVHNKYSNKDRYKDYINLYKGKVAEIK